MQPSGTSPTGTASEIILPLPTPQTVADWLAELPLAHPERSLDALLALLRALNAKPDLSGPARLALADAIRPRAAQLAEQIDTHSLDAALPYPPDLAQRIETTSQLRRELGNLYAYACPASRSAASLWLGNADPSLAALYRAFQHWGLALLDTARLYREPDPAFWPDLYRAYRLAEAQGAASAQFGDPGEPPACRTPLGQFKRILLFAMADYGRYRQRDMRLIYRMLGEWADHVAWEARPVIGEQLARFRLDLDSEHSPYRIRDDWMPAPSCRFLFIGRLIERLLDKSPEQRAKLAALGLNGPRLPTLLAKSLFGPAQRRSERLPLHQPCQLFIGFQELVAALDPRPTHTKPRLKPVNAGRADWLKAASRLELLPMEHEVAEHPRQDERALRADAVIERLLLDSSGCPRDEIWGGAAADRTGADPGTAGELLNTDPHGYCVLLCDGGDPKLQAGSLVGIAEAPHPPHIGVIRWLAQRENGLRFGVELLSPSAESVAIWDELGHPQGKGLLLPPIPAVRAEPEILLPPTGFHAGVLLRLSGKTTHAGFHLGRIQEATASFSRFKLIPAPLELAL